MNKNKAFCENCRKDTSFTVKEEYMSVESKGETYNCLGKKAICDECNNEVFVSEISNYNLEKFYNETRKKHNIISLENILEIPEKYSIGKRPLSLLLGWGEQTFSRYYEGDLPTKQYSMVLQKIYDDPKFYLSILESNKDKLKSKSTYEKSKQAALTLLGGNQLSDASKINVIALYLLCKCEDITPLALQKLLYYVQGFYYAFMNQYVFEEDCEAWIHGPVYKNVYFKYREYRFDPINISDDAEDLKLSVSEKIITDSVIKNLSCYSGKILEGFTHVETPWLAAGGDLPLSKSFEKKIEKKLIGDYFTAVKEKYNMLNPSDIQVYSKKMFKQIFM